MSSLFLLMIWCRPYDVARNGTSPSFSTLQVHSKVVLNLAPHHPGLQTAAGWADKAHSCRCMMGGCSSMSEGKALDRPSPFSCRHFCPAVLPADRVGRVNVWIQGV